MIVRGLTTVTGAIVGADVKPDGGSPTIVPIVLVGVLIVGVGIWMIVAVFLQRGPSPEETALAYEWAWDRLDFPMLWELSAPSLRDGRGQLDFVADKVSAYGDRQAEYVGLVEQVMVESMDAGRLQAVVRTRLVLADRATRVGRDRNRADNRGPSDNRATSEGTDGADASDGTPGELRNELYLKRDGGTWRVAAYRLHRRAHERIA